MAEISLSFNPTGTYQEKEGKFNLRIEFTGAYDKNGKDGEFDNLEPLIKIVIEAVFAFPESTQFNEIPSYFYQNSIAIIFPYIRSFVTTLTAIANVTPVILPTMNLSSLEGPLKKNTKCIP